MRIRRAAAEDVDAIVAANIAIARETEDVALHEDLVRLGVEHALEDETAGVYYVCEGDGAVVGQLLVTREWSDWRNGFYWWIQSVYVAPRARRTGVLRALYQHVLEQARANGVLAIKLYVDRENHRARASYEALGMQQSTYDLYETVLADGSVSPPRSPSGVNRPAAHVIFLALLMWIGHCWGAPPTPQPLE